MAHDLRPLTAAETVFLPQLMADAFERGRLAPPMDPTEPESLILGVFDGARLVAAATVHDISVNWGLNSLRMGGVAGVVCVADQRGRGHVGRLLRESLLSMRDAGQVISGLYPFAYAFYRRYGWEWVGEKRRYTVPLAEVPSYPEGQRTSLVNVEEALSDLKKCYAQNARRYRGATDRLSKKTNWWTGLDDRDGKRTYVYAYRADNGVVEGYMAFRYPNDGGDTGSIGDFFANSDAAYRGLLSVVHYHGTQIKKVTWTAPIDDVLPVHVMHHDLQTIVSPLFMGRVVDVAAALQTLAAPMSATGKLSLKINDPICEWNNGSFTVDVEVGSISVRRSTDDAGVTIDIQTLSQAFWGQPSLDVLRRAGKVVVADERQFSLLSLMLPPAVCYLQDFF